MKVHHCSVVDPKFIHLKRVRSHSHVTASKAEGARAGKKVIPPHLCLCEQRKLLQVHIQLLATWHPRCVKNRVYLRGRVRGLEINKQLRLVAPPERYAWVWWRCSRAPPSCLEPKWTFFRRGHVQQAPWLEGPVNSPPRAGTLAVHLELSHELALFSGE